jgi:hypothetical protein
MNGNDPIKSRAISTRWVNLAIFVLGAVSLLLYFKGAHDQRVLRITTVTAGMLGLAIPYFLASWVIVRARPARSTLMLVIAFALSFRAVGLSTQAYLSTDLYRYIWDGRVAAAHINPYRYIPAAKKLTFLRDKTIYPHINRKDYAKTIYPPVAQMIFLGVTRISESVTCMRLTMVAAEALAVWGLALLLATYGLPAQRTLLYAWNPLVGWEFAGGGHVDAIMIAFVVLTLLLHRRGKEAGTGVALACAVLTKLFPIILAPALYRRWRWGWKMPAAFLVTLVLAYLPYWIGYNAHGVLGFLPMYTDEEGLQSGDRFFLLNLLPAGAIRWLGFSPYEVFAGMVVLTLAGTACWALWGPDQDEKSAARRCLAVATIFVAVLSSGYDWYYAWLVPFLCIFPYPWLFWMTASSMVLYLNWIHFQPYDVYRMNAFIYFPAAFLGAAQLAWTWRSRRHDKPAFAPTLTAP